MPGFNHLPGVKPAEPGWDTGLYNLWSDQMRRLDNLREIGDCDDRRGYGYWRALREHRASVEREFARLRTATPEQYRAWQPVISYFRGRTYNWERDYGCTQVPG